MDDAFLGSTAGSTGGWRPELVNALNSLHPGSIRDWQEAQLGETFAERTAGDTAHGPTSFDGPPSITSNQQFSYTMTDFFALANTIGANPWVILPTTTTDAELSSYGSYLESIQATYHFPAIYIELGNENWNGIFRGGSINDTAHYTVVANRDFGLLKAAASNDPTLKFVGGGQYANLGQIEDVASGVPAASYVAAAPYFWGCQNTGEPANTWFSDMWTNGYAVPSNLMIPIADYLATLGNGQTAVTYEEGLSTNGGDATTADRLNTVAAYGSGGAYMQEFINLMTSGFGIQNVFVMAQNSSQTYSSESDYGGVACTNPPSGATTPLWGIVHDLNASSMLVRPSGLAVTLANQAITGNFYPINTTNYPGVTGAAFKSGSQWTALFSNGTASSQTISVTFPAGTIPTTLKQLTYTAGITDNNETSPLVSIGSASITNLGSNTVSFTILPWGAVALLP
jgi:hypothetical protein